MRKIVILFLSCIAWPALATDLADFSAHGNEPAWSLQLGLGGVSLSSAGDKGVTTWPLPKAEVTDSGLRYLSDGNPAIDITHAICRDTMTAMPYPAAVRVTLDGQTLTGCGGDPATLLMRSLWHVTAIHGADVPADLAVAATLRFDATGNVSGVAFCNNFTGTYALSGEGLTLGPLAATRKACPDPQMSLEKAMFDALAGITRFDIGEDGSLRLMAGDTLALSASPGPN